MKTADYMIMRTMRRTGLAFLLTALGCQSGTGVRDLGAPVAISATEASAAPPRTIGVVLGQNGFTISGQIETPTPCYQLSAYRAVNGSELTITVVATAKPGACVQMLGRFDYTITTPGGCPAHLVIVHHYVGTGWPDRRVFDDSWGCYVLSA